MKIAIVHDYIKEYGGAERVLEELLKVYPKADVYTALYAPDFLGPHKSRFEIFNIHQSFFRYIPFSYKLISPLRLLSPLAFYFFNLSSYDVVIVSQTGAYFPNTVRTHGDSNEVKTKHVCYTHTPPRYLYGYMTAREWRRNSLVRVISEVMNHVLRVVDYYSSRNVDYFVANSQEVASRIKKFYRRDAVVVYPPVDNVDSRLKIPASKERGDYYIAGGRLARAKGMDVVVDAFNRSGCRLKIFGKSFAGYGEELLSRAKENIEFLGEVGDEEKLVLMNGAKAYIFASYDEDFGITPVEALSQGTPVVAYKSGGVQETVVDGKTGILYTPNSASELNKAIEKLERMKVRSSDCIRQAKKFSSINFGKDIQSFVSSR